MPCDLFLSGGIADSWLMAILRYSDFKLIRSSFSIPIYLELSVLVFLTCTNRIAQKTEFQGNKVKKKKKKEIRRTCY